jgi:diguanylate cyclase (GGDEF)-like protein
MIKFTKNVILQALDNVPAPTVIVAVHKPGHPVIYVNSAAQILIGRDGPELIGMPFADILAQGSLPESISECHADRQQWHTHDGISVPLDVRVSPLENRPGQLGYWMLSVVGDAAPMGELQAHEQAVLRSALVDARRRIKSLERNDPATGLANRGAFDEMLERDWSVARREQRRIGIIVFSLDCLAEYRQIYGRHATDSLLKKVGHAIGGTFRRSGDFGARISYDRFAVLIGDQSEDQAKSFANRIAAKVRSLAIHHPRSTVAKFVTVSYGVSSELPAWTKNSVTLLEEAERQLEISNQPVKEAATPSVDEKTVAEVSD